MIKCLRALPAAMAAEHALPGDVALAAPGELLSIPVHICREHNNPECQCRRIFVGLHSGQPSTLARVCIEELEEVLNESSQGSVVMPCNDDVDISSDIVLHGVESLAYALRHFEPGTLLRVTRTAGAVYLQDTWKVAVEEKVGLEI